MKIIQIVGYKNSGKTTLVNQLLQKSVAYGIRVASIKHHGHGGKPDGYENTDSELHRKSGAIIAGVVGENAFQLTTTDCWELPRLIPIYELFETELLIVEGFKQEDYKKIVLIKNKTDWKLIETLSNICAIVTLLDVKKNIDIPVFRYSEIHKLFHWIMKTV
ncbi:molybdopterin-guanine dinucleotide biosynthesis protein B [Fervidibacillus albus]|uniref:Molybdopterin-guanine dinucleotide biosynthesis protein B n=1 Tax=Fervidibacillus albus TaxID=2980026 RepID=A0A9E8LTH9_9BACI|nr:molybdopterin-guanine dinucleotide biosynthesis protein B [Fervidibacillus albus]WAA09338.1 molybdopterin-guanine dinucleotide biosynthesis protein B [Fervidibacillus albus]